LLIWFFISINIVGVGVNIHIDTGTNKTINDMPIDFFPNIPDPKGQNPPTPPAVTPPAPGVDINGNPIVPPTPALDANGNPIVPPAVTPPVYTGIPNGEDGKPVHEYEIGTQIKIGDIVQTIDGNGNLVDKDGKVISEAKEVAKYLDELERRQSLDANSVVGILTEALGFEPVDGEGNPVAVDSIEGIQTFIKSTVDTYYNEGRQDAVNELYSKFPVLDDVIQHLILNNGRIDNFNSNFRYSDVQLDESNKDHQKQVLIKLLTDAGTANPQGYADYVEKSGTLFAEVTNQLTAAVNREKIADEQRAQAVTEKQRADAAAAENYYKQLKQVYTTGGINGYTIPEKFTIDRNGQKVQVTRNDVYEFVSKPVNRQGESMATLVYNNMTEQQRIQFDAMTNLLLFTGGNLSHFVQAEVGRQKVIAIKALTGKTNNGFSIVKPNDNPDNNGGKGITFQGINFNR
jgi:hypothetical protein